MHPGPRPGPELRPGALPGAYALLRLVAGVPAKGHPLHAEQAALQSWLVRAGGGPARRDALRLQGCHESWRRRPGHRPLLPPLDHRPRGRRGHAARGRREVRAEVPARGLGILLVVHSLPWQAAAQQRDRRGGGVLAGTVGCSCPRLGPADWQQCHRVHEVGRHGAERPQGGSRLPLAPGQGPPVLVRGARAHRVPRAALRVRGRTQSGRARWAGLVGLLWACLVAEACAGH
mmetsp:Transcript_56836/g.176266  ORF Transcript_56836/g.176266 Transcript_56836/m.176266 type:complete len:232 (-) Transcript_56836:479-1174(-)